MLTGGKLADLLGRRRIFIVGLVVFTLSSLACGLAPSAAFLIGARAVQGVGAALMNPATLSIITATFPPQAARHGDRHLGRRLRARARDRPARRRADRPSNINWNWIFFVNVPVGALGIVASRDLHRRVARHLARAEPRPAGPRHLGARPVRAQLRADRGQPARLGVAARSSRFFVVAAVLLVGFVLLELHQRLPMLDLSLFRIGAFAGANVVALLVSLGDVRRLLLRLALHPEHPRLLADAGGRDLPADDRPDHPRRAVRRAALRPHRLALADGRRA